MMLCASCGRPLIKHAVPLDVLPLKSVRSNPTLDTNRFCYKCESLTKAVITRTYDGMGEAECRKCGTVTPSNTMPYKDMP